MLYKVPQTYTNTGETELLTVTSLDECYTLRRMLLGRWIPSSPQPRCNVRQPNNQCPRRPKWAEDCLWKRARSVSERFCRKKRRVPGTGEGLWFLSRAPVGIVSTQHALLEVQKTTNHQLLELPADELCHASQGDRCFRRTANVHLCGVVFVSGKLHTRSVKTRLHRRTRATAYSPRNESTA